MNADGSTISSTTCDRSSVRPRNRRLVSSGNGSDPENREAGMSTTRPERQSQFPPGRASAIQNAQPLRASSLRSSSAAKNLSLGRTGYGWTGNQDGQNIPSSNASSGLGLWESWSSLQSIASTLLGSDAQPASKSRGSGSPGAFPWTVPVRADTPQRSPPPQWGPPTHLHPTLAPGSREERQAMLYAKRREALLLAEASDAISPRALRKRRDSDHRGPEPTGAGERDHDALVYVHQVKPDDTLAGVTIRYQCQPAVFRKVNRLWPNDKIQVREHVLLPVEYCAIRGRRVDVDDADDADDAALNQKPPTSKPPNENFRNLSEPNTEPSCTSPLPDTSTTQDAEYSHEYYVSVPGIPENVQIARIPRRTLGFFPTPRRKSQSQSQSYFDSPRVSLDQLSPFPSSHLSPRNTDLRPTHRTNSVPSNANPTSAFTSNLRLHGPGGVGSLRSSSANKPPGGSLSTPGPGPDSLNKMFAHHLPDLDPPRSLRDSFDSVRSVSSSGLENVGGVLEGWARKVVGTTFGGGGGGGGQGRRQSSELLYGGRNRAERVGDLIELENNNSGGGERWCIGQQHEENGEDGWQRSGLDGVHDHSASHLPAKSRSAATGGDGSGDTTPSAPSRDDSLSLLERFPPRGRVVDAQTSAPLKRK